MLWIFSPGFWRTPCFDVICPSGPVEYLSLRSDAFLLRENWYSTAQYFNGYDKVTWIKEYDKMTQMHVPDEVLDKGHKNIYTDFLETENLEQQETKDAVTRK